MDREIDKSCAVQRHTAPMLDSILGYAFPVLDHGFVRVVDYMGNDSSIVEAAVCPTVMEPRRFGKIRG